MDKLVIFDSGDSWRMFASFKNGPYAIFSAEEPYNELYRSGASYKESAILKDCINRYFIVKTTSGIFSINFRNESQDTWFLIEEDPEYILSTKSNNFLIAL